MTVKITLEDGTELEYEVIEARIVTYGDAVTVSIEDSTLVVRP